MAAGRGKGAVVRRVRFALVGAVALASGTVFQGVVYATEVPLRERVVEVDLVMVDLQDELALRRHALYERSVQVNSLHGDNAALAKETLVLEYREYDRLYAEYQALRQDRQTLIAELDALL